jgi:plastocyanin
MNRDRRSSAGAPLRLRLARIVKVSASLCVVATTAANAAALSVQVSDRSGKPLSQAVVALEPLSGKAPAKPLGNIEIGQLKRQFVPQVMAVTTGTPVVFSNFDTVRHHVYSFSSTKTFELKLYAGVPNKPIVFDKPGISIVGCNIHDQMAAWIVVLDTSLHAVSGDNGRARIDGIAPGSYRLRAWHPGLSLDAEWPSTTVRVDAADFEQSIVLGVTSNPLGVTP